MTVRSGSFRIRHAGLDPASIQKKAYELDSQCPAMDSGPEAGMTGGSGSPRIRHAGLDPASIQKKHTN